eukprot:1144170-Pelagomonas_calceolata.AAC.3
MALNLTKIYNYQHGSKASILSRVINGFHHNFAYELTYEAALAQGFTASGHCIRGVQYWEHCMRGALN